MLEDNGMIYFHRRKCIYGLWTRILSDGLNLKCLDDLFLAYSPIAVFLLTKGMD